MLTISCQTHRKHRLCRTGPGLAHLPPYECPSLQVRHLTLLLLHRIIPLRPLPPLLFAQEEMGALRVLCRPDALHRRRRPHRHPYDPL